MRNLVVLVDSIKEPIQPSPGFEKKTLSECKLDLMALCGLGCLYCSSNAGYYLRIHREEFAAATEDQLGSRILPADDPRLTFLWPDILPKLDEQLSRKSPGWGAGQTLVFSMLTDGFSPEVLKNGTTEAALTIVLDRTSFRIRILTKNAIVGSEKWLRFFRAYPGRFVVGLSTGTMDDEWARMVEVGTSSPSARLRALRRLQDAGVPTFGMLCPVFPDLLSEDGLERLIEQIRPELVEHVWAEPYNDRDNWHKVRLGYDPASYGYDWLTRVYENGETSLWSSYATELYRRLRARACRDGWLPKLRYLLYEGQILAADAPTFAGLEGVLLQSKPTPEGLSKNPQIAALQAGA
jgi:DNA repair photolyase